MGATAHIQIEVCPSPIFIVGSPRSGTSILAWSLAEHPDLWTSGEIQLLYGLFSPQAVLPRVERELRFPNGWFKEEGVSTAEFLSALGTGLNALLTSRSGGRRWIDQTPVNTLMAGVLAEMFPGARFVHILRDGRNVVDSMVHFGDSLPADEAEAVHSVDLYPPWATDFAEACRTWANTVAAALELEGKRPERCHLVRYERFIRDPETCFDELSAFLGVRPHPQCAATVRSTHIHSSHSAARTPLTGDEVWKRWQPVEVSTYLDIAGDLTAHCQYAAPDLIEEMRRASAAVG